MSKKATPPPTRKNASLFIVSGLIAVLATLVAVGFGLASSAAGGGQLEYLEITAEGTDSISYVLESETAADCGASSFTGDTPIVTGSQVSGSVVNEASSICFRAHFNNGNYIYKQYLGTKTGLWTEELAANGIPVDDENPSATSLFIYTDAQRLEYVALNQRGLTCNSSAFSLPNENIISAINENQYGFTHEINLQSFGLTSPTDVDNPAKALCLRSDYQNGNYIYKKYGDNQSDIFFSGGWAAAKVAGQSAAPETAEPAALRITAPGAGRLQYIAVETGAICNSETFANATESTVQTIPLSTSNQSAASVDAEVLARNAGICFRASHGNIWVYKKYSLDDEIISFHFVWAFALEITQNQKTLRISANREITNWEAVSSDAGWTTCDPSAFEPTTEAGKSGRGSLRDDTSAVESYYYSEFELTTGDDGKTYCIKAADSESNYAYATFATIHLPYYFGASANQVGNTLRGTVYSSDRETFDNIQWTAMRSDYWSNSTCNEQTFVYGSPGGSSGLPAGSQQSQVHYSTNSYVSFNLSEADLDKEYCFRVVATADGHSQIRYLSLAVTSLSEPNDILPVL